MYFCTNMNRNILIMKSIIFIVACIFGIIQIQSCSKSEINTPGPDYTVFGRVTYPDGVSGIPNARVMIEVENNPVITDEYTDALGYYQLSNIPSGKYLITATDKEDDHYRYVGEVEVAQNDKEFNMFIGKKYIPCDYYRKVVSGVLSNVGYKFDLNSFMIGENFYYIDKIEIRFPDSNIEKYSFYKTPPVPWDEIDITYYSEPPTYNGDPCELLFSISLNGKISGNQIRDFLNSLETIIVILPGARLQVYYIWETTGTKSN